MKTNNVNAKYIKVPFDIELAKKIVRGTVTGRILTKNGVPVRILCFNRNSISHPIVALIPFEDKGFKSEAGYFFTVDGRSSSGNVNENKNDLIIEILETIRCDNKQIGCKFCKGEKKKVWKQIGFTRKGGEKYGYVEIVEHPSFGETCDLRICGDKLCIDYNAYSTDSSFNDEIKINFCPMCGRKLSNKNE